MGSGSIIRSRQACQQSILTEIATSAFHGFVMTPKNQGRIAEPAVQRPGGGHSAKHHLFGIKRATSPEMVAVSCMEA